MRKISEVDEYEDEAFDKVWLMRTHSSPDPHIEAQRQGKIEAILETYDDIPKDGYTTFDYGYWCGVLATLRWMRGHEKHITDT